MSTVYYLVNEKDCTQVERLKMIGDLLILRCKTLFRTLIDTDFLEQKKCEVQDAISSILGRAEAPMTDICAINHNGVHWREFGSLRALKQHLTDEESAGNKYVILDDYNHIISIDDFRRIVLDASTYERNVK